MGGSNLPAAFGYVARELGKRKIAFLCARESLKEPRLGPELKKAFGGVYIAIEGFTPESAAATLARQSRSAAPHRTECGPQRKRRSQAASWSGWAVA
jgi:hypothetical protein